VESVRLAQVVEGGDALRGELVDVLEDDVGVGAVGDGDRGGRGETGVARLALGVLHLLLGGRVAEGDGDGHGKGRLGLVEGTQGRLVVVLQAAAIRLDVVAALGL
jgi:hypothetical protein